MVIKKLTIEGKVECGLLDLVKGKKWCFTAVMLPQAAERHGLEIAGAYYGLGAAVANEAGFYPVPAYWCHSSDYQEMHDHAEELNKGLGIEPRAAAMIVCSSMRALV